ncbi:hypothetical protein PVK06_033460 [Gossypium arboreum]|uniref:Uncharacterized protein n=1 Tax=Gossypium arboreum TaxID=29729 RepID=A0ABR0NDN8_GOSAR|nr:hypothetical protein PVK06_033460 [Gossypium arboreum]
MQEQCPVKAKTLLMNAIESNRCMLRMQCKCFSFCSSTDSQNECICWLFLCQAYACKSAHLQLDLMLCKSAEFFSPFTSFLIYNPLYVNIVDLWMDGREVRTRSNS